MVAAALPISMSFLLPTALVVTRALCVLLLPLAGSGMQLVGVFQEQSGAHRRPSVSGRGMIRVHQQETAGTLLCGEVSALSGELELPPTTPPWAPSGLRRHIHAPPRCYVGGTLSAASRPWGSPTLPEPVPLPRSKNRAQRV